MILQMDDVHVRDNLTVEALPLRIEGREVKKLRCKDITLVKVLWGGSAGESLTWEREDQMRELYPTLFSSGNFQGGKFFKWGRVVTPQLLEVIYLMNY